MLWTFKFLLIENNFLEWGNVAELNYLRGYEDCLKILGESCKSMSLFRFLDPLTLTSSYDGFLFLFNHDFCPEERYYICHGMCWTFPWCHSVVFAAVFDIIKWIDISNICGAQRVLIQWRWTMSCSHSGTASGVCLFNHSCRNEIKRQCVVKSLKLLPQQRDQEGPTAGSRVKNKPGLATNVIPLSAVSLLL